MDLKLNALRFSGEEYVFLYNQYRPTPPLDIIDQSLAYLNKQNIETIVDLGCGTGLSSTVWSPFAQKVIGIEPSEAMISVAKQNNSNENLQYRKGFANETRLESGSVDIVACSQAFHWMEPQSTLEEVNRILRKGGVMVIYDVIWPPSVSVAHEIAYKKLFYRVDQLTETINETIAHKWEKKNHITNINKSGFLKFTKETYYHKTEELDNEKFIGIALSQGGLEALIKREFTDEEIGINTFVKEIRSIKLNSISKMTYNYRVIFGVK